MKNMTTENGSQNNSPQWKNAASTSSTLRDGAPKTAKKKRDVGGGAWGGRRSVDVPRGPAPQIGGTGMGERDLNFFDVLGILRRQLWIVVLMTIIGGKPQENIFLMMNVREKYRIHIHFHQVGKIFIITACHRIYRFIRISHSI